LAGATGRRWTAAKAVGGQGLGEKGARGKCSAGREQYLTEEGHLRSGSGPQTKANNVKTKERGGPDWEEDMEENSDRNLTCGKENRYGKEGVGCKRAEEFEAGDLISKGKMGAQKAKDYRTIV